MSNRPTADSEMPESDEPESEKPESEKPEELEKAPDRSGSEQDSGPGWMPAILAATLLMAIAGFITCGVSTWFLFQKRSELAVRTLRGSFIPSIEQSRILPDEKEALVDELGDFANELERGEHENWQAAGVMQRLQRVPVLQWGEISAVESFVNKHWAGEEKVNALLHLSRLRRSAELADSTSFDFEDVLGPVHVADDGPFGRHLMQPLTTEKVADCVERARLVADRAKIPQQQFDDIRIDEIVKGEIDKGIAEGTY
ncbi:hypothetical protein CA13_67500 [Planctomycetes bacterium CA13]|uniref:Uncharacterized protein n=1 Tax=Novipirellula herctigrandis TaxID=2527986 RepID=A0A5C5YND0_9BACT|nr:hypothetical protein CA13_67500 [Planctomycetes bacterium CA13]